MRARITSILTIIVLIVTTGCSKQRCWDKEQRHLLKKEIREVRKHQGYMRNIPEDEFVVIADSATEIIVEDYPNYEVFMATDGAQDTIVVVVTRVVSNQIAANHKYMHYLFPYMSLVASGILPVNLAPEVVRAYYDCVAKRVNENFSSMEMFMRSIGDSDESDSLVMKILNGCAVDASAEEMEQISQIDM